MYVTIRNYAGTSGLADELVKSEDEVKNLISGIQGFQAYYLLKTADGDAVSVSVFDDQAGAEQSTQTAREWLLSNLPDLAVSPPQVFGGEVVING